MAYLILPSRRTKYPSIRAGIDWSHPAAASLKNALVFLGGSCFDAAQGKAVPVSAAMGTLSYVGTPFGLGLYTNNGSAANVGVNQDWSGPSTTLWQCYIYGVDSNFGGLWTKNTTGTTTQLSIGRNSTSDDWCVGKADSGTQTLTASSITGGSGTYRTFAFTNSGAAA